MLINKGNPLLEIGHSMARIVVIVPAFNEEQAIGKVLADIPEGIACEIVVVDNNSSDATAEIAQNAGVTVVHEPRQGYGFACLKGIEYVKSTSQKVDVVVFLDADYSDYPGEMVNLVQPIIQQGYDLVIGSRLSGQGYRAVMSLHQILGNRMATTLIKLFYGACYTDLGPFRAIKFDKLLELGMTEKTYGWTVEMQVKAAKHRFRCCEVPVSYRSRIGTSKISGTARGTFLAGYNIVKTLLRHRL